MSDAYNNAQYWLTDIVDTMAEFYTADIREQNDLQDKIQGMPLSIETRTGWTVPGQDIGKPVEFRILLSYGGPSLQIIGELDYDGIPYNARLQYQDWGTPWTDLRVTSEESRAIEQFCLQFYFGE